MAGQDYPKRLEAGATQNVNISGDYIYCKFADRPLTVIMDGSRTTMVAGDNYRPGGFKEFEIENTDKARPLAVVLTIGQGNYTGQIVRGEIAIEPILKKADGTTVPDTRQVLSISLDPQKLSVLSFLQNDVVYRGYFPPEPSGYLRNEQITGLPNGGIIYSWFTDVYGSDGYLFEFNHKLEFMGWKLSRAGKEAGKGTAYNPKYGVVGVDSATTIRRYTENTAVAGVVVYTIESGEIVHISTWRNGEILVARNDGKWDFLDIEFNLVRQITAPVTVSKGNNNRVAYNFFDGLMYYGSGVNMKVYNPDTFELLQTLIGTQTSGGAYQYGFSVHRDTAYSPAGSGAQPIGKAVRDFQTKPEFRAVLPGCAAISALYRGDSKTQTSAVVVVEEGTRGVKVKGEVIKAALEFYYKRQVVGDYLDSIYSFDLSSDEGGNPFRAITSGNRSFKAAGIIDDFGILTPGNIAISFDDSLQLGGFL